MSWQAIKYRAWGNNRFWVAEVGLIIFKFGRRLLKWSGIYCSYCGKNPGMDSSYSRKGLRCFKHTEEV